MTGLGNQLATCSANGYILTKTLADKEYSKAVENRANEWFIASVVTFAGSGLEVEDARRTTEEALGEIIYGAGLEDIVNDKPAMIKLSEELIYYINDNCLPLDEYVEQAVDRYMQFLSKDEEG